MSAWNTGVRPGKSLSVVVDSWEGAVKSLVVKRSIAVDGHKTSVTLEAAFWNGLKQIASDRHLSMSELVSVIDSGRLNANLSSAIRLFVLDHYRTMTEAAAGQQNPDAGMGQRRPPMLDNEG
jgi:predicted DNA-binding ribbon-helix-helix protein